ncbi:exopolyphosphatase [Alsobacter metallidurans]|uniref:exopolyphosphatase n=1 Tax=Alsobacter metallidurans TaxID=340221 RepID=A0A917I723_9HYPH|nr:exopolyphosphatase [Alsobacter metallidurans]GGH21284.1 exopolyphosphatase [Alsobacter metallidurans]
MPELAQGRLKVGAPVAIIDIGSNSVRLVAYEGQTRSPTPIFNEKVLCGLGRNVLTTGKLASEAMEKALSALARFRVLCQVMKIEEVRVLATAAARDAANGAEFLARCEQVTGQPVELISGKREAKLSALGVASGIWKPDGVVGDLGGGSLELIEVKGQKLGSGVTLPLGGLALQDRSGGSVKKAVKLVRDAFEGLPQIEAAKGRAFYAVGGTWRALARLHMKQRGYPLHVMHNYVIPARDAVDFARLVERVEAETLDSIESISAARRPLLAYGALVLEQIIRMAKPSEVVVSAMGVREGLLFEQLDDAQRAEDPLLAMARELNVLRSRSPRHGEELCAWTDRFMASTSLDETAEDKRLRHAACLLADIGWRAHPDYRGEQSLNIIAHAGFAGVDHPGRAYLALAVAYRHLGLSDDQVSPRLRELASPRMIDRARILGAAMRVAYLVSAGMPGVLPRTPLHCAHGQLQVDVPRDLAALANDRLFNRLKALARIIGRTPKFQVGQ